MFFEMFSKRKCDKLIYIKKILNVFIENDPLF